MENGTTEQNYAVSQENHGDFVPSDRNAIVGNTDVSRSDGLQKSGYGIYIQVQGMDIRVVRSLGCYSSVFQTEVMVIKEAAYEMN